MCVVWIVVGWALLPGAVRPAIAATMLDRKKIDHSREILQSVLDETASDDTQTRRLKRNEVFASLHNLAQPPMAAWYDCFEIPVAMAARLRCGIGHGHGPGESSLEEGIVHDEPTTRDPVASTFWQRPLTISQLDLGEGFGRSGVAAVDSTIWHYAGPKRGSGLNPGFHAKAGGAKIRLKFAETKSEPFAARIFWALGYHVDPTYFCRGLKVRYDRRLFEEFNSRQEVRTQFRIVGVVPIYTLRLQRRFDPFDFIAVAVMKDGRRLNGRELKEELLAPDETSNDVGAFRPEVEAEIEYLVTMPANVQFRDRAAEAVGPWRFDGLGHEDCRELRGVGLLGAWIGWNDCRPQNTQLRVIKESGTARLVHYFTDLGGGLGKADGFFSGKGELPKEFPWTFTKPPVDQGRGRMTIPFRVTGYRPIEHNEAFERMTVADARWMARLIAQLTERQIAQALEASGFESWEVRLYTRKLIHRRDRMICDLGLENEISLLGDESAMPQVEKRQGDQDGKPQRHHRTGEGG